MKNPISALNNHHNDIFFVNNYFHDKYPFSVNSAVLMTCILSSAMTLYYRKSERNV